MITKDKILSVSLTVDDEVFNDLIANSGKQLASDFVKEAHDFFGVQFYFRSTSGGPKSPQVARIEIRDGLIRARLIPQ